MRRDHADVLIVGGGLAAQRTCETLRRLGYDGRVRVIGEEPHPPYDRPPLSNTLLTGEQTAEPRWLRPAGWYADHEIELLLAAPAAALDPEARLIRLEDGGRLRYRTLVIATGSRPRRLESLPLGERVRELRTIDDASALRQALRDGIERLAIVGAGLVGMEVASSATRLGLAVTMIEAAPTPLARVLPPILGDWLARLHARAGVEVLLQSTVDHIRNRARHVDLTLSRGRRIRADLVLVAAGTTPATTWLADSGLPNSGAIPVDTSGRTAIPGIHAAGDAASFLDPATGRHTPTQHWEAAARQGTLVAHTIIGAPLPATPPPLFWSDQHGTRIQFVGHADAADRVEIDGEPDAADFTAWLSRGERPIGALLAGRPRALTDVRERIADARPRTELPAAARLRPASIPTTRKNTAMTIYLPVIDEASCCAHGDCQHIAPDVFAVDAVAIVVGTDTRDQLLAAADACPAGAITIIDNDTGERIYP
jgi:3-phenylpropionate/trans-cinnamate dioxygenase ferredoxin reductase subunit